uniref:RING finger protein 122 n=1 Tax=Sarcophilus harrisii TaxID=9305 RepID=G3W1K7_SARHA
MCLQPGTDLQQQVVHNAPHQFPGPPAQHLHGHLWHRHLCLCTQSHLLLLLYQPSSNLPPPHSKSKLRHQAQSERYGYKEVVLKGDAKKLHLYGQTCAVCLEDFKGKDELGVLPCQHAFHRKCLVKWLEVRCVCPMCNKPIAGPPEATQSIGTLLDELV